MHTLEEETARDLQEEECLIVHLSEMLEVTVFRAGLDLRILFGPRKAKRVIVAVCGLLPAVRY